MKPGNLLIAVLALAPLMIWAVARQGTPMISDWPTIATSLGQITGLVGMTLFALTFILATRAKPIESLFGGLDRMYLTHHVIGGLAFMLLLFHPVLLALQLVPGEMARAARFLLPGTSLAIDLGIYALLMMTLLIVLTFFVRISYRKWKISHKLLGIAFIIAAFHIFMVTTDITLYPALKSYMILVVVAGAISFGYASIYRERFGKKYVYLVDKKIVQGSITYLTLAPEGNPMIHRPGQFVFLKFDISPETHPFTIASAPGSPSLRLLIKNLGDDTEKIAQVRKGSRVTVEGPYGRFSYVSTPQIWIAGGIGITPFISFVEHMYRMQKKTIAFDLYYTVRNREDAAFLPELQQMVKSLPRGRIIPVISGEQGRLTIEQIKKTSGLVGKTVLMCGPDMLTSYFKKELKKAGVPARKIITEEFDLR